jgi:hypothetical protein
MSGLDLPHAQTGIGLARADWGVVRGAVAQGYSPRTIRLSDEWTGRALRAGNGAFNAL